MDSRLSQIFTLICVKQKEMTIADIAEKYEVSHRTIYNDIKKLNELLQAANQPEITINKSILTFGSKINFEFEKLLLLEPVLLVTDSKIRRMRILEEVLLTSDFFSLDELAQKMTVSRNTITKDLSSIKKQLSAYAITLETKPFKGIRIIGQEKNIRHLLIQTLTDDPLYFNLNEDGRDKQILEDAELILTKISKNLDVLLSDAAFDKLILAFWVSYQRLAIGKYLEKKGEPGILSNEEKAFLEEKKAIEASWKKETSIGEILYLAEIFNESPIINQAKETLFENWVSFNLLVNQFIEYVARDYHFPPFISDSLLFQGIINHLRPSYYRVLANSQLENPMYAYIRENYESLNGLIQKHANLFEEELGIKFDKHELSYFTLFFIASIERNNHLLQRKANVVLVCGEGISTSAILKSKLETTLSLNILGVINRRNADEWLRENPVDLIVSTIDFQHPSAETIKVEPLLPREDADKIRQALKPFLKTVDISDIMQTIQKTVTLNVHQQNYLSNQLAKLLGVRQIKNNQMEDYQPMLIEVLDTDLIETNFPAASREEAVRKSGELLVRKHLASPSYVDAMLENVEVNGTYIVIAPGIAMPHARPEKGALDIGLSIVTLKEPVVFGHPTNDPVKIVIGLCAIDHQSHLKALSELVEILSDESKTKKIIAATQAEDIMNVIIGGN